MYDRVFLCQIYNFRLWTCFAECFPSIAFMENNDNGEVTPAAFWDACKAVTRGYITATTSLLKNIRQQRLSHLRCRSWCPIPICWINPIFYFFCTLLWLFLKIHSYKVYYVCNKYNMEIICLVNPAPLPATRSMWLLLDLIRCEEKSSCALSNKLSPEKIFFYFQ